MIMRPQKAKIEDEFYTIKFNVAIGALGVDVTSIPTRLQRLSIEQGVMEGSTPQEAALFTLVKLPLDQQRKINPLLIQFWIYDGEINLKKPTVQTTLKYLQLRELLESDFRNGHRDDKSPC